VCFFWLWKRIREEGLHLHEPPPVVLTHYEPFRASMLLPGGISSAAIISTRCASIFGRRA
jgi:hypothetical protein